MGQMLVVYDPDDPEEVAFFQQQRHDPYTKTLLSGLTPPSTFTWTRIFKKQNRAPKVDFARVILSEGAWCVSVARSLHLAQVEQDLSEVNVAGKEDVQTDFIHPKELEKLFLKPGQRLVFDGVDVEPIPGLSVAQIIATKQEEHKERLLRQMQEEKRRRKEEKRARKQGGESTLKKARTDAEEGASDAPAPASAAAAVVPVWQRAAMASEAVRRLEAERKVLEDELAAPECTRERAAELTALIEAASRAIAEALTQ